MRRDASTAAPAGSTPSLQRRGAHRADRAPAPGARRASGHVDRSGASPAPVDIPGVGRQAGEATPSNSCKLAGTARRTVGRVFVRTNSRPNSSAKNGFPTVTARRRTSSGRARSSARWSLSRWCSAPRLSGPTARRRSRSASKHRSNSIGTDRPGASRTVTNKPTGASCRRRRPICSAPAEAGSSHSASSRATTIGPCSERMRRTSSTASPTRAHPERPHRVRRAATPPRAHAAGDANERVTSSSTGASNSESPENDSEASASTPRHVSTHPPLWRAASTPALHKIVLPMPASPTNTSATGRPRGQRRRPRSRQARRRAQRAPRQP